MFISKARKDLLSKFSNNGKYKIADAFEEMKKLSYVKFNESVDVAIRLGIDTKKPDQNVRGVVVLPNGNGVVKKVLAICNNGDEESCIKAGADYAGNEEYFKKIEKGWFDFDIIVTVPSMMGRLGMLGRVLGPKGLMPNPKTGGVSTNILKSIEEIKKGRVEFRNDKTGIIHSCIGKISFESDKLVENFNAYYGAIVKARPVTVKGNFIKSVSVSSTMGPGFYIDVTNY